MRRVGGISLFGVAAAAAAAGLSAHATSAAPLPTSSTLDVTYSCPVQKAKVANIYASVKLRAAHENPAPGALNFDTGIESKTVGGTTTTKAQASVVPKLNGVKIDKKNCKQLTKQIPFSQRGLPVRVTATAKFRGYTSEACNTATRIIFRLQVHSTGGKPTSAVLAVQSVTKHKSLALVSWSPKKVLAHFSRACSSIG
jgi:hypothetical protein